jgi:hypothetical protein
LVDREFSRPNARPSAQEHVADRRLASDVRCGLLVRRLHFTWHAIRVVIGTFQKIKSNDPMTAPRRRWSFGLRTLFVVVTACAACCRLVVAQRRWQVERSRIAWGANEPPKDAIIVGPDTIAPWSLGLFGEPGYPFVQLGPKATDAELERIQKLFPEAAISRRNASAYPPDPFAIQIDEP